MAGESWKKFPHFALLNVSDSLFETFKEIFLNSWCCGHLLKHLHYY